MEPRLRQLLAEHPKMPATLSAERVGWTGSISRFRETVARLRDRDMPRRIPPIACRSPLGTRCSVLRARKLGSSRFGHDATSRRADDSLPTLLVSDHFAGHLCNHLNGYVAESQTIDGVQSRIENANVSESSKLSLTGARAHEEVHQ